MRCPARSFGHVRQVMARIAPSHTAAASSNDMPDGFGAIGARSRTHRYSAWAPNRSAFTPNTSSPTANSVTADPTSTTTPANSLPRIVRFGRRSPANSRMNHGHGARKPQSVRFTVVACTSTSTSSSRWDRALDVDDPQDVGSAVLGVHHCPHQRHPPATVSLIPAMDQQRDALRVGQRMRVAISG